MDWLQLIAYCILFLFYLLSYLTQLLFEICGFFFWKFVEFIRAVGNYSRGKEDWETFQTRHVIDLETEPGHRQWNQRQWNDFLRRRNLLGREINSFISVSSRKDVLNDFNYENAKDQQKYISRQSRMIYQCYKESNTVNHSVYIDPGVNYVAAVKTHWWDSPTPIHFEKRVGKGKYALKGCVEILDNEN